MYYGSIPKCIAWISFQVILQHRFPGGNVQIRPLFLTQLGGCKRIAFLCRASWLWYPCLNRDPPTLYTKFLLISSCCTSSPSQLRFCYRGAGWPKAIDWRKLYSLSSGFSPEAESHLFGDFFLSSGSYCKLNSIFHSSLYPFLQQGADIFLFHPSLISFGKGRHWVSSVTISILSLSLFPSHKWKGNIHHLCPRILLESLLMQAIWRISGHHNAPFFTTTSL